MRTRAVIAATALLMIGAGCSSDPTTDSPRASDTSQTPTAAAPAPRPSTYVALGDSFTAGPGIDPLQADSGYCGRSQDNWPTRMADSLDLTLTDVSCSGATTADLASTVRSGALSTGPGLVTVSAGGNDGGLFLSLIRSCTAGSDACGSFVKQQAPPILKQTTTAVVSLLDAVRSAAPDARIVLVGYPRLMPADGTCDAVGIAAGDVATVVSAEEALDTALASAAEQADVPYVSARDASTGHDACAGDQAWTNGASPGTGDGIFFHPNRRGMAAVASLVEAAAKG
ncbi:SGNH/GDSL hydrolase family protein [Aeromicrobium wangtongii]|uniref:SGNH/GDSL hydrolase family protein n=1 Tax=Aeromicrobium wangtongii TaxID=2969247 RepID=UPI002017BB2B|nr:SGNH/GDSL hydrolase family protein [Aeromicrobium wangtongii]MCL3818882.1 SGNH/GDSL hydrolase family protein [Aeromicrobium wangtongii]